MACSVEDFPSAPRCDPCNDPLYRACADVTPVPPDLTTILPPLPEELKGNMTIGNRYCHMRNYYNPAKSIVYPRFSLCDWTASAQSQFDLAQRESKRAQKIDANCWHILNGLEQRMVNRQCSNTKKLANRSLEISFWKEQLITEVTAMNVAIINLKEAQRVTAKYLTDLRVSLEISEECLLQREKRVGIDQCHDDVEKSLSKEILIFRRVMSTLQQYINKANTQIRLDRCVQAACDVDIGDKNHSQALDDKLHQLRNSSCGLNYHPAIELVDNTVVDKKTWVKYTRENIVRSEKERAKSDKLQAEMETYLGTASVELYTAYNYTNHLLSARVQETTDVKMKLQDKLVIIVNDIRDIERKIDLLRKSIVDKQQAIKVAQTRLSERTRRLNLELCYDEPKKGGITSASDLTVRVGEIWTSRPTVVDVIEVVIHPQFSISADWTGNDAALLRLSSSSNGINVIPVCISPSPTSVIKSVADVVCIMSGLGQFQHTGGQPAANVIYTNVKIVANDQCRDEVKSVPATDVICGNVSNDGYASLCTSDKNGNPLLCEQPTDGIWTLVGLLKKVTSLTNVTFSSVDEVYPWIKQITGV